MTVQSCARQLNILTYGQTTALVVYSVLKSKLIADWSVEYINPDMTPYRMSFDVRVWLKKIRKIKQTSNFD